MTGLLPEAVRESILGESLFDATQSFGVVVFVLLVVLLLESELLGLLGRRSTTTKVLPMFIVPLLVAFLLTAGVRVLDLAR